jgi:hypothetical protein
VPQWAKVLLGSGVLILIAVAPDAYFNWSETGLQHQERHAGNETAGSNDCQDDAHMSPPAPGETPKHCPKTDDRSGESDASVKLTDLLLVIVGFLQFGAIVGQIIIYGRQTKIMGRQLASMRTASLTARRVSDTLPRVERAYISGGGEAWFGTAHVLGSGAVSVHRLIGGPPNWFRVDVNNYGKTPGELIEFHIGFLDGDIPQEVPKENITIHYYLDWIKPDSGNRPIKHIPIPDNLVKPIIFGRFYYRDIFLKKLHSSGFIYDIPNMDTSRPIRAPRAYTEERDENSGEPPQPQPPPNPTTEGFRV